MLIAQQLHVQYSVIPKNLRSILDLYIPNQLLQKNTKQISSRLEKLVIESFQKVCEKAIIDIAIAFVYEYYFDFFLEFEDSYRS